MAVPMETPGFRRLARTGREFFRHVADFLTVRPLCPSAAARIRAAAGNNPRVVENNAV
jgi:hypothetical protein